MEEQDLDTMSEFLVMAATLLDIKSRMLLPAKWMRTGRKWTPHGAGGEAAGIQNVQIYVL